MATILTAILACLATVGLGAALLRALGFTQLPSTLLLGASYGVGAVSIGKLLHLASHGGLSLSVSSWATVAIGLAGGAWALSQSSRGTCRNTDHVMACHQVTLARGSRWFKHPLILVLLAIILLHLVITLSNNITRPIFPWDAVTTWMYRGKAWVMQDAITSMAFSPDWIVAGGSSGYAIYASHYPTTLSVFAAFTSALTGTWSPGAASIPWTLCLLAACMITHGALRLAGTTQQTAVVGAYLLCSLPLLNVHASLAGYGDLWMALLSGGGLALFLLHRVIPNQQALWLGIVLLLAGSLIKTEGWIWMGMGFGFLAIDSLARKIGYSKLIISGVAASALLWASGLRHLSLGPLGTWGLDSTHLYAGPLGSYALRAYNPAPNYLEILSQQANFLLLGGAYVALLLLLSLVGRRSSVTFWTMAVLIALSQGVIFGLSSFSVYAETGTAITRLLLQFTPVMVITTMMGWHRLASSQQTAMAKEKTGAFSQRIRGTTKKPLIVFLLVAFCLLTPGLVLLDNSEVTDGRARATFKQRDFIAVVGRTKETDQGRQFTDSPMSVGVLKAPAQSSSHDVRGYLFTDLSLAHYGDASFYWVLDGESEVQSISLGISGPAIEDLGHYSKWDYQRIKEMGYLVQGHAFTTTSIKSLSFKESIGWLDWPTVVNHWTKPERTSHRIINNTLGHDQTPLSRNIWFSLSVAVLAGLCAALAGFFGYVPIALFGAAFLTIWMTADLLNINSSEAFSNAFMSGKKHYLTPSSNIETTIEDAAHQLLHNQRFKGPVLIVAIDELSQLAAQKLPFDLLPRAAAHTDMNTVKVVSAAWQGPIVVFGSSRHDIIEAAHEIALEQPNLVVEHYQGFSIVSGQVP